MAFALVLALACGIGRAQPAPSNAIEIPAWFANTFLDFREDIGGAAREGKRLVAYFGQEGCPYCRRLMTVNFARQDIVQAMRERFVAVALDIHGDRETRWLDGKTRPEKELARFIGVQFTPTLLFFDEQGNVVARLNGYYPPDRFAAVLDYVSTHAERRESLAERLARVPAPRQPDEPLFMSAPQDLARRPGARPLAVVFEARDCAACDELHTEAFRRSDVGAELARFDVARLGVDDGTALTTPDGRRTTAASWARELQIAYTPSMVFFDDAGREVFRVDAYLRPFHLASCLEYVASGAYRSEPSFQRFVQARAERLRREGMTVDLWR